jgi:3-phenylpropionate/trans-cinnamate dioxygenase ferredoxin subunit
VTGFVEVAKVSELSDGMMKKVVIGDRAFLLARVQGRFYATDALCPHLQADLTAGSLQGTVLTCPLHGSRFDIRNGSVIRWTDLSGIRLAYASRAKPPHPLRTYPVRVNGDRVLVAAG